MQGTKVEGRMIWNSPPIYNRFTLITSSVVLTRYSRKPAEVVDEYLFKPEFRLSLAADRQLLRCRPVRSCHPAGRRNQNARRGDSSCRHLPAQGRREVSRLAATNSVQQRSR